MSNFVARQAILIVGLVIGLALGLTYTWVIEPVELINTYPALLRTDYRRDWVRLVAVSYTADGNLERARTRLAGIAQEDVARAMQPLIEEYAAAGHSAETLRRLSTLAQALGVHTPAMLAYLGAPAPSSLPPTLPPTPTLTPTPPHSPTPRPPTSTPTPFILPSPTPTSAASRPTDAPPLLTPTPSLLARLELAEQELMCQPGQPARIEIVVQDERGKGLAGVEVWLTWPAGADRAMTGLKPQNGAGYADFDAEWGVSYSLSIGELGRPLVAGLRLETCPSEEGAEPLLGSWRIVLEPPAP
jgi:hypothetical protein